MTHEYKKFDLKLDPNRAYYFVECFGTFSALELYERLHCPPSDLASSSNGEDTIRAILQEYPQGNAAY